MERSLTITTAAAVRALIARRLKAPERADAQLGRIELRPHQRAAVTLIEDALEREGGALLADEVGLGKTYVALAIARTLGTTLILAPAALREMWMAALAATGVCAGFASYEALSRGWGPSESYALVIADEAHHLRNRHTARYHAVATLTVGARVLLLSATPVHNRASDLRALLAIFLGERASALATSELARFIVRRTRSQGTAGSNLPSVAPMHWLSVEGDDDLLEALCALPAPLPPSDGGDAGALVAYSLLRLWASSRGALRQGLRRRLAIAGALCDALERERHPSRRELRAWSFADDTMQLAFPELMVDSTVACAATLIGTVREHARALRELLARIGETPGPDASRAAHLVALRLRHGGRKIVAFSQYADTVRALFSCMRGERGVAALTAAGGVVAGGALTRAEVLVRFAPRAQGRSPPPEAERIDLLLTTDLLSEGVNLQDASVVVHLDLPWTAARLEQRVGRAARLGAEHARVELYALAPPAPSEVVLRVERRLRDKITSAAVEVGVAGAMMSLLGGAVGGASTPEHAERVRQLLAAWRADVPQEAAPHAGGAPSPGIIVAGVRAARTGLLALFVEGDRAFLAASTGGPLHDDPRIVARALEMAGGNDADLSPGIIAQALASAADFSEMRRGASDADLRDAASGHLRRALVERIASIIRRTPFHRRAGMAELIAGARRVARSPFGAGAERALEALVHDERSDEEWLSAIGAFAGVAALPRAAIPSTGAVPLALLVLRLEP